MGTRPEIIKMAPVVKSLKEVGALFKFVATGQHYDYIMLHKFIEELELPLPNFTVKFSSTSPGEQIANMIIHLEKIILKEKPGLLLIQGDTNSMLAAALASFKHNIEVGHIEAGLRSYDWRMQEEHNRRMVDHASQYLFAPTLNAQNNLEKENVWGRIFVTGNTVIDAVSQHMPLAIDKSKIMERIRFDNYAIMTLHRAENIDNTNILRDLVQVAIDFPIPVVFPAHPRTMKKLEDFGLKNKLSNNNVQLESALGYFDFLLLMKHSDLILTDSGGLQEEATSPLIRKPALVLRKSTERPEAVETGFAKIVGVEKERILHEADKLLEKNVSLPSKSPYGKGDAGLKIVNILSKELQN